MHFVYIEVLVRIFSSLGKNFCKILNKMCEIFLKSMCFSTFFSEKYSLSFVHMFMEPLKNIRFQYLHEAVTSDWRNPKFDQYKTYPFYIFASIHIIFYLYLIQDKIQGKNYAQSQFFIFINSVIQRFLFLTLDTYYRKASSFLYILLKIENHYLYLLTKTFSIICLSYAFSLINSITLQCW